jgi:hypothetical protein
LSIERGLSIHLRVAEFYFAFKLHLVTIQFGCQLALFLMPFPYGLE